MRNGPAVPLSDFTGGIDRDSARAGPNALEDARNLWMIDGDVRVRPAFRSFLGGPVWMQPPGTARVFRDIAGTPTLVSDRALVAGNMASGAWIYVISERPFDGLALGDLNFAGATLPTTHKRLQVQFGLAGVFPALISYEDMRFVLDSTRAYLPGAAAVEPFVRRGGRVHWHRHEDWVTRPVTTSIGTVTGYVIRFRLVSENGGAVATAQAEWEIDAPGLLTFEREAINGLFHSGVGGRRGLVSMADRRLAQEMTGGANIGACLGESETRELELSVRKSTGLWGQVSCPNFLTPGGAPSSANHGTAGEITDQGRDLNKTVPIAADGLYFRNRPYGNVFLSSFVANGGGLTTSVITTTDARLIALRDRSFEWFMLEVVDPGSSSLSAGNTRLVRAFAVSGGVATFTVESAFGGAPASDTTFAIIRPPSLVHVYEAERAYHLGALSAAADRLVPDAVSYRRALTNYASNARVNFEVRDELRLTLGRGDRWSATFDDITRELVMVNGGYPLTFNGDSVRPLAVADQDSPLLQQLLATVAKDGPEGFGLQVGIDYRHQFRSRPPSGHIAINFGGRIVILDHNTARWSLPHTANNIWPLTYEAMIRDARGSRVTAAAVLYDRLIVSTKSGIFEGTLVDGVGINFRPTSHGVGFTAHAAVANIAIGQQDAIIGPAPDGLIVYAAGEPIYAIDSWDRVIPGGISEHALDDAVGCAWRQRGLYFMAFSARTSGEIGNNRILVYDYVNKVSWIWSAPFGVSSLAIAYGAGGKERLIIGTEDGMIQTLSDGDFDDDQAILDWFAETRELAPLKSQQMEVQRVVLVGSSRGMSDAEATDDDPELSCSVYLDGAVRPWSSGVFTADRGEWSYRNDDRPWDEAEWPENAEKSSPIGIPRGGRGHSLRVRIAGTARHTLRSLEAEVAVFSRGRR